MVVRVLERGLEADVGPVIVACDDPRIADVVRDAGGRVCMTDPELPSGSDRVYAALCVVDPEGHHEFTAETLKTTCGYSPYEGISVRGAIEQVWLRGKLIAKNNQFCGTRGAGRLVARRR